MRRTNTLLRAANAIRHAVVDIKRTWEKPNLANFMWTIVQISRAYTALRRLHKLIVLEAQETTSILGLMRRIVYVEPSRIPERWPIIDPTAISVRADAFLDNRPITLDRIDMSGLPEESRTMIQAIIEEDAEITVADAREKLEYEVTSNKGRWSGTLASSIGWQPQTDGVRVLADAYYAAWVEEGHQSFGGYHYMDYAFKRMRLRLPEKVKLQIRGLIYEEL